MKNIVFAIAMMFAGSAFAADVPLPPKRSANLSVQPPAYGAAIQNGQVVVRAPLGADMQVDVDGADLDITVTGKNKSAFEKILPWNWKIWK